MKSVRLREQLAAESTDQVIFFEDVTLEGKHYYALDGQRVEPPENVGQRPAP